MVFDKSQFGEFTNATAAVDSAYRYGYDFDDIGNRETSTERGTNTIYAANALNQYAAITTQPFNYSTFQPVFDADMRPRRRRRVVRRSEATEPRSGRKRPRNQTLVKTATGIWD